jgi:hypothetical protein
MIMVFNATFKQYFSYIVAVSLIGLRKPGYPKYTTDLPQVTDKRYHIMLYQVLLATTEIGTHNFSTNCTGSFKEKKIIKNITLQKENDP